MFQLIHLTMTAPRRDPTIFSAFQSQMRTALAGQIGTPDYAFSRELARALSQDHPRSRALEGGSIDQMDLDKSIAFYRQRFGNATGFTFVSPAALRWIRFVRWWSVIWRPCRQPGLQARGKTTAFVRREAWSNVWLRVVLNRRAARCWCLPGRWTPAASGPL
jgi:hypothetical protein